MPIRRTISRRSTVSSLRSPGNNKSPPCIIRHTPYVIPLIFSSALCHGRGARSRARRSPRRICADGATIPPEERVPIDTLLLYHIRFCTVSIQHERKRASMRIGIAYPRVTFLSRRKESSTVSPFGAAVSSPLASSPLFLSCIIEFIKKP